MVPDVKQLLLNESGDSLEFTDPSFQNSSRLTTFLNELSRENMETPALFAALGKASAYFNQGNSELD